MATSTQRLGEAKPLNEATRFRTPTVLYDAIQKPDGGTRLTTANHAMRAIRRAWNVVYRSHPSVVPEQNPFARMGLRSPKTAGTKHASREQLMDFVSAADELNHAPIGTAALIAFEWLLREIDIISRFSWSDYRPPNRPDAVRLFHGKTEEEIWLPLDHENNSLYPELEARLAETPRYGPLIIMRNKKDRKTGLYLPYKKDWFRHSAGRIRDHANLPKKITFASFRHGGLTELGDAELTDQSMMALSAHKTRDMLTVYSKRNEKQRTQAAKRRLDYRTTNNENGTNKG